MRPRGALEPEKHFRLTSPTDRMMSEAVPDVVGQDNRQQNSSANGAGPTDGIVENVPAGKRFVSS